MATRYWVGGSGNWDTTTTHWSASSGGASGASVPTSADDVVFDNLSNATAYTVTLLTTPICRSVNIAGPLAGNVTIAGSAAWSIYGSMTLAATGITRTYTGAITFAATTTGWTITTNGVALASAITFNGAGGSWTLASALSNTGAITLTNGTFDINGFSVTSTTFASANANTRTLAFGSTGAITVTSTGVVFNNSNSTGFTVTGTDPKVIVTNATATATSIACLSNLISFYFTAGTYSLTIISGTICNSLDFTGFSGALLNTTRTIYGNLTLSAGMLTTAGTIGTLVTTFAATTPGKTIRSNGKDLNNPWIFNGVGGSWILQDNAIASAINGNVTLTNGTIDLNGFTFLTQTFKTATGTKNITFNGGTLRAASSGATAFNNAAPTGFTTTAGTGTGIITMTSASAKTFVGGGSTYNCTLNQGGSGALTISGNNTFTNITNSVQPTTVIFAASSTNTFANFNLNGTAGNLVTINSSTAGTRANLVKTGVDVSCDYLNIKDIAAA